MGYIFQQLLYDSEVVTFDPGGVDEIIAQSVYFDRNFILRYVTPRFSIITIDPAKDVRFRCEVREAYGDDNLLDPTSDPVISSEWITDDELVKDSYVQFPFDRVTEIPLGFHYLCFISNITLRFGIEMSIYTGGSFLGNLIKVKNGVGTYSSTSSLAIQIDGQWQAFSNYLSTLVTETYMTTTIRDETS